MLFEGTQITGVEGEDRQNLFLWIRESCVEHVIGVTELDSKITQDGTYTLALVSDTVLWPRTALRNP